MAIVVGENSYLTLVDFKAWADLRGKDYSAFTDPQIEAALVVSSVDYIDPNYKFKGDKVDEAQLMDLPTDEVAIADVANGAAQAAWQELNGELFISPTANSSGNVTLLRTKLDVLEKETEYSENSAAYYKHDTTQIDKLLKPFVTSGAGGNMAQLRKCW